MKEEVGKRHLRQTAKVIRASAEFVVRTKYEVLPAEVVQAAKMMIMDILGCGVGC